MQSNLKIQKVPFHKNIEYFSRYLKNNSRFQTIWLFSSTNGTELMLNYKHAD